jgi:hypothetical protein
MNAAEAKLFKTEGAAMWREQHSSSRGHGFFGATGIERCLRDALGMTVHLGHLLLREDIGRPASSGHADHGRT